MGKNKSFSNNPFSSLGKDFRKQLEADKAEKEKKEAEKKFTSSPEIEASAPSEETLFAREMRGVQPFERRDGMIQAAKTKPTKPPQELDKDAEALAQLADLVDGVIGFDLSSTDEYIEGISEGLDKRLLKRLRQGHFAVQGHLDLHGQTRQQARVMVERFIAESRLHRKRCVLLVHGRGLNSKDQIPVLKESLKIWLARGRIARAVLAFCSAKPVDGGAGAVYVLLRK